MISNIWVYRKNRRTKVLHLNMDHLVRIEDVQYFLWANLSKKIIEYFFSVLNWPPHGVKIGQNTFIQYQESQLRSTKLFYLLWFLDLILGSNVSNTNNVLFTLYKQSENLLIVIWMHSYIIFLLTNANCFKSHIFLATHICQSKLCMGILTWLFLMCQTR